MFVVSCRLSHINKRHVKATTKPNKNLPISIRLSLNPTLAASPSERRQHIHLTLHMISHRFIIYNVLNSDLVVN